MKYLYLLAALLLMVGCDQKAETEEPTGLISKEDMVGTWEAVDGGEYNFTTYAKGNDTTIANTAENLKKLWGITMGKSKFNEDGTYTSEMVWTSAEGNDSLVVEEGTWVMNADTVTFSATKPMAYTARYINTSYENGLLSWKSLDPFDIDQDGDSDDMMSGVSRKVEAAAAPKEEGHE